MGRQLVAPDARDTEQIRPGSPLFNGGLASARGQVYKINDEAIWVVHNSSCDAVAGTLLLPT